MNYHYHRTSLSSTFRYSVFFIAIFLVFGYIGKAQMFSPYWLWGDSLMSKFHEDTITISQNNLTNLIYDPACYSNKNNKLLLCSNGSSFYDSLLIPIDIDSVNAFNPTLLYAVPGRHSMIVPLPCHQDTLLAVYSIRNPNASLNTNYLIESLVKIGVNGQPSLVIAQNVLDSGIISNLDMTRKHENDGYWLIYQKVNELTELSLKEIGHSGASSVVHKETIPGPSTLSIGYYKTLKFSPDGRKILIYISSVSGNILNASAMFYIDLLAFNNVAGSIDSNFILTDNLYSSSIPLNSPIRYLAEFSPDSKKVYFGCTFRLYQTNISVLNQDSIDSSNVVVYNFQGYSDPRLTDIRISPYGKVALIGYTGTPFYSKYLCEIRSPNEPGDSCDFVEKSFILDSFSLSPQVLPNGVYFINIQPTIEIIPDSLNAVCAGNILHIKMNNSQFIDSVLWYIGDTTSPQQFIVNDSVASVLIDSSGSYPIMAVTYSGCRLDTFFDTAIVIPVPAPNLGPDTILCEGDTIAISNDWAYSYLWNTGDTTDGIQIMLPDTYWLELSNYCGVARDTVIVDSIIEALVIFPALDTLLCLGDTLPLDAHVDQGTYTWHDGSTDSVFAAFAADTVWATAINACGTSSDTISVRFTDVPVLPLLDSILCVGDTQFINLVTDSLSTFLWYSGDTTSFDTITTENHYWVQETNLCGSDLDTFFVAFVNPPVIDLGNDTVFCGNTPLTLDASTRFGSYAWSSGTSDSTFTTNAAFFSADDSVEVFVTVTNACMSVQDSILLVADFPLSPDLGEDTVVCFGSEVILDPFDSLPAGQAGAQSAGGRVSYLWNNGDLVGSWQYAVSSDTVISVSVTNTCGTYSDEINILRDDTLKPDLGPDSAVCFGDSLTLRPLDFGSAQPALDRVKFLWQDFSEVSSRQFVVGSVDSAFFVTVTNACGSATASVSYVADSLPEVFGFDTLRFCDQGSVDFQIPLNDRDRLFWSDGDSTALRTLAQSKNWTIRYINHCGTSSEKLIVVRQYPPVFRLAQTIKLCDNEVELYPDVEYSRFDLYFDWSTGEQTESIYTDSLGYYRVTVSDDFGCADSAQIRVITCGADFYAPNAFTPDGDRLNDTWDVKAPGMDDYQMAIYDRWGNEIFTFSKGDGGWDGTVKGEPAPSGVYLWIMTGSTEKIQYTTEFTGKVTLIR